MTIDNNLLWVLIGTAGISLLTLVYVLVDEGNKRRRYEQQKEKEAAQPPSPPAAPEVESGIPAAPSASAPEPVAAQAPSDEQETSPEAEPIPADSVPPEEPKAAAETTETTD